MSELKIWRMIFLIDIKISFKYNLFGDYGWWYGDAWAQADSCVWALLIVLDVSYKKFTLLTQSFVREIYLILNIRKHLATWVTDGHRRSQRVI